MKYFAFIDGEQKGPFDLDELIGAGVRPSTYVWCRGMDDWQKAEEVADVCQLFLRHLSGKNNPQPPAKTAPGPASPQTPENSPQNPEIDPEEEARLRAIRENVPLGFQNQVRKSGTTPGPPLDTSPDLSSPPQVSLTLAILSMLLCFFPAGVAAVVFTYKSMKCWNEALKTEGERSEMLREEAHDLGRRAKMWVGITVSLGLIFWGFIFSKFLN